MKKTITFAILIATLATACKKGEGTKTETKTDILVKSSWTVDSYGVDTNKDLLLTGIENETRDCDRDNIYSFSANGNLLLNYGALKCGSSTTVSTNTTWRFYLNEANIEMFGDGYVIKSLTSNRLEIYSPGPASNYILILKR